MSAPIFSIIVPVYKVEKYLDQCIRSILEQDFTDFELILIDDGSPDGCGKIIDSYAENDSRIKALHKENGGVVSARNAGFAIAAGEYTVNVDGDDCMLHGALRCLYENIRKTHADVYLFGFETQLCGKSIFELPDFRERVYSGDKKKTLYERLVYDNTKRFFTFGTYPGLWQRAVKSSLFKKFCFNIDESVAIGEDFAITLPLMLSAETICVIRKPLYFYRVTMDSASRSFNAREMDFFALMLKTIENSGADVNMCGIKNQLGAYTVYVFYNYLCDYIRLTEDYKKYTRFIKNVDDIIFRYIGYCRYNFKDARAAIMITILKKRLWRILWLYVKRKGTK